MNNKSKVPLVFMSKGELFHVCKFHSLFIPDHDVPINQLRLFILRHYSAPQYRILIKYARRVAGRVRQARVGCGVATASQQPNLQIPVLVASAVLPSLEPGPTLAPVSQDQQHLQDGGS